VLRWPELSRSGNHVAIRLEAFIVFAHDDQIDVVIYGADTRVGTRRADIGKQAEALAHDRVRIDRTFNLRIGLMADRSQDEAVHLCQRLHRTLRKGRAMRIKRRAPDRHRTPVDAQAASGGGRTCDTDRGRHDFKPDIVAIEDAYSEMVLHESDPFRYELTQPLWKFRPCPT